MQRCLLYHIEVFHTLVPINSNYQIASKSYSYVYLYIRPDVVQFLSWGRHTYRDNPGLSLLFGTSETSSLPTDMDIPGLYPDCPGTSLWR